MEGIDIKELNKTQLVLVTLLITFIVSIATGIITVSLMQQMPKSVPQTINNVIQRTIEKVSTVPAPVTTTDNTTKDVSIVSDGDAIVYIYPSSDSLVTSTISTVVVLPGTPAQTTATVATTVTTEAKPLGQGVIISDMGLILVDSSILTDSKMYRVILNKINFDATILKKFGNGFSILKITAKKDVNTTVSTTKGDKADKQDLSAQAAGAVDTNR